MLLDPNCISPSQPIGPAPTATVCILKLLPNEHTPDPSTAAPETQVRQSVLLQVVQRGGHLTQRLAES